MRKTDVQKELDFLDQVESMIRDALIRERKAGYTAGIRAAAEFAGTYDKQISGTVFKFEDLILLKFNLIGNRKPRRKVQVTRTIRDRGLVTDGTLKLS
jgi:hypothetical protein